VLIAEHGRMGENAGGRQCVISAGTEEKRKKKQGKREMKAGLRPRSQKEGISLLARGEGITWRRVDRVAGVYVEN